MRIFKRLCKKKTSRDIQNEALTDAPQNIAAIAPKHIENQEVAREALIRAIFGGLAGGADSNRA